MSKIKSEIQTELYKELISYIEALVMQEIKADGIGIGANPCDVIRVACDLIEITALKQARPGKVPSKNSNLIN